MVWFKLIACINELVIGVVDSFENVLLIIRRHFVYVSLSIGTLN